MISFHFTKINFLGLSEGATMKPFKQFVDARFKSIRECHSKLLQIDASAKTNNEICVQISIIIKFLKNNFSMLN